MARKRFGQNFLHERRVIDRIVAAIDPQPADPLIEIGPGHGALTDPLLALVERLRVIEIDRDLIAALNARAANEPRLEVIAGDALAIDYGAIAQAAGRPLRLVGNLPYNISSPLLFALLASAAPIRDMHFMLQKEVVDRMVAPAGSPAYGRLSVAIAARAEAAALFDVGPGAFSPPPKVQSAVVRLVPRPPAFEIVDQRVFDGVITDAFNQRRKTLRNALKNRLTADDIEACCVAPGERAERVSPAAFARLANAAAAKR